MGKPEQTPNRPDIHAARSKPNSFIERILNQKYPRGVALAILLAASAQAQTQTSAQTATTTPGSQADQQRAQKLDKPPTEDDRLRCAYGP